MKNKIIISSILTIAMCLSMIAGSTFALFTSNSEVNVTIGSAKVDIDVEASDLVYKSTLGETLGNAKLDGNEITLTNLVPGDYVTFTLTVTNNSTVAVNYRALINVVTDNGLYEALEIKYDHEFTSAWKKLEAAGNVNTVKVTISLPEEVSDAKYMGKTCTLQYFVEAVQGNAPIVDEWDGTADTSWYEDAPEATEYTLNTAEEFAGFAKLVNSTSRSSSEFANKTFTLNADIDLGMFDENNEPISFEPIGGNDYPAFSGTFDGNGHTIYNMYQSGWAFGYEWGSYGSMGLFGELENATIKNLTISGMEGEVEGGDISAIAGSATGTCVFENITIENTKIGTYNNGNGSIIGWSGAGHYTFKNIKIADDVVLGGLWGSFDSSIGGIVGQGEPGATYIFEDVYIACRIDAYNDCTASYDYYNYRMCGMIIGRLEETTTIDGSNYPDTSKYNIQCTNVTVVYGEWADYHYCRTTGERAQRVEAGYAYSGISADYDHSRCDAHHMYCIPFDQIFGGDQYAVKGLKTYNGVTVIYNNDMQ